MNTIMWAIGAGYLTMSVAAFLAIWRDKRAAILGKRRTSEASLHRLELLGGWPGALLAMRRFRHKTRKSSYQNRFWLAVALHLVGWLMAAWLFFR